MQVNIGGIWKNIASMSIPIMCGNCDSSGCSGGCVGSCSGQCSGSGCSSFCVSCVSACASSYQNYAAGNSGNVNASGPAYGGATQIGSTSYYLPPQINVGGAWKKIKCAKVNIGGSWKQETTIDENKLYLD